MKCSLGISYFLEEISSLSSVLMDGADLICFLQQHVLLSVLMFFTINNFHSTVQIESKKASHEVEDISHIIYPRRNLFRICKEQLHINKKK